MSTITKIQLRQRVGEELKVYSPDQEMIAHREWGAAGLPFVFQEGLRADPQQIAQITRIDGLPAGSAYPFSEPRVIE